MGTLLFPFGFFGLGLGAGRGSRRRFLVASRRRFRAGGRGAAPSSPSSTLPFLMTSGSVDAAPGAAASAAGVSSTTLIGEDVHDHALGVDQDFHALGQLEFLGPDSLVHLEAGDIRFDKRGNLRRETPDADFAHEMLQHAAADFDAGGFAFDMDRHPRFNLFLERDAVEVHMPERAGDGMALDFLDEDGVRSPPTFRLMRALRPPFECRMDSIALLIDGERDGRSLSPYATPGIRPFGGWL